MPHSRSSSSNSNDSFKSFKSDVDLPSKQTTTKTTPPEPAPSASIPSVSDPNPRLSPDDEALLLHESLTHKTTGNSQFTSQDFSSAVQTYDKALASLPDYLDYEIAVLRSNIAACHVKMREWREAVESAGKCLERLEGLSPVPRVSKAKEDRRDDHGKGGDEVGEVEEVDDRTADAIERLQQSGHTHDEVQKLRIKALMRRAKGRTEIGTWAELQGAEEDYTQLLRMQELGQLDRQTAQREVRSLRPRLDAAKSKEMAEMMGKLKDMGNGLLKPFGLSTDMFNFVKDEKTGGYSMNMGKGGGA